MSWPTRFELARVPSDPNSVQNSENPSASPSVENPRVVSSILTLDTTIKRLDPLITERRAGTGASDVTGLPPVPDTRTA